MTPYIIRDVTDPADLAELEAVQVAAWGYRDREVLPATMFRISGATGGVVLGAYLAAGGAAEGNRAVGLAYGFPALGGLGGLTGLGGEGELWHHSHLLALRPEVRGSGLAVALKLAQRERVLAQGIRRMTWTFDPLVTRNARLNFGKLGVRATVYLPDWYGPQIDRLLVSWELNKPHAARPAPLPEGVRVLQSVGSGPGSFTPNTEAPTLLAEVPLEVASAQATAWRLALREVFQTLLPLGYVVTDLARDRERAFYVLTRP